ncbi:heavy-metal-associated domain-containing protein [Metabacillus sp. 84]|uniref:heavy-metal-associated domain-containing protein n=1 Tax=unclassified Metabacillus TaxID=2675274 RepID=UPI003CF3B5E5
MRETTIQVKEALTEEKIQMIESRLAQTEGIERSLVDVQSGSIWVSYNEMKMAPELIMKALNEHGMEAEEIQNA